MAYEVIRDVNTQFVTGDYNTDVYIARSCEDLGDAEHWAAILEEADGGQEFNEIVESPSAWTVKTTRFYVVEAGTI